jgi:hypothetical protein
VRTELVNFEHTSATARTPGLVRRPARAFGRGCAHTHGPCTRRSHIQQLLMIHIARFHVGALTSRGIEGWGTGSGFGLGDGLVIEMSFLNYRLLYRGNRVIDATAIADIAIMPKLALVRTQAASLYCRLEFVNV